MPDIPAELAGREEIRAWGERRPADYLVQTTHPGTIQLDGDTASGRAYIQELGRSRDGKSGLNYAIYHDRYRRTPDGWKFTRHMSHLGSRGEAGLGVLVAGMTCMSSLAPPRSRSRLGAGDGRVTSCRAGEDSHGDDYLSRGVTPGQVTDRIGRVGESVGAVDDRSMSRSLSTSAEPYTS